MALHQFTLCNRHLRGHVFLRLFPPFYPTFSQSYTGDDGLSKEPETRWVAQSDDQEEVPKEEIGRG